jgi:tripartite-type tricarboxylate transporter receptor subunit TctC
VSVFYLAFGESLRVVRIIARVSVSTPPDIRARIIANALSDGEGWKVVVENKPGGVMRHLGGAPK